MIKTESKDCAERYFDLSGTVKAVVGGVIFSYILLMVAFVILAGVYTYTPMPDKFLNPAISVIGVVSLFLSGFVASAKAQNHGWLHGTLAGVLYTGIRLISGLMVFKGWVPSKSIWEIILISVLISAAGGIFGVNAASGPRRKKHKKR